MTAKIIDKEKIILAGIRSLGYSIQPKDLEKILNVYEHIKNSNQEVTLKEITDISVLVDSLFEDEPKQK